MKFGMVARIKWSNQKLVTASFAFCSWFQNLWKGPKKNRKVCLILFQSPPSCFIGYALHTVLLSLTSPYISIGQYFMRHTFSRWTHFLVFNEFALPVKHILASHALVLENFMEIPLMIFNISFFFTFNWTKRTFQ